MPITYLRSILGKSNHWILVFRVNSGGGLPDAQKLGITGENTGSMPGGLKAARAVALQQSFVERTGTMKLSSHAEHILKHVSDLTGQKVLIVGDVGLDEYVLGQAKRISPEAPVPVVDVEQEDQRLGLSGNVAQNIFSLGGTPILVSVVGEDGTAARLRTLLEQNGVGTDHLVVDPKRPTTRKTRVMVQHHHIVRIDFERRQFLSAELESKVLAHVQSTIDEAGAVIIQDYAKGVISENLVQSIVRVAHDKGKRVLVDPSRTTPLRYYRGVDLLKANYDESVMLSGEVVDDLRFDSGFLERVGRKLMATLEVPQLVITRGKEGMRLFEKDRSVDLPTYARQVFDVTGAGDTVIAAIAMAWGAGFTLERACALANFAAGVVVGKVGCVPCVVDELVEYISAHSDAIEAENGYGS